MLKERQRSATTTSRSTASQKLLRSRDLIEVMADRNFEVAALEAAVSHVDAWDHCSADSVEDRDTTLENVRQWITVRIAARIAVRREVGAQTLLESRETRAGSAINQVTGRATVLTG